MLRELANDPLRPRGPERPWRDPGGATEPSRVAFGRSSWPIEPLRAPKVARGGRLRRPRSRFGSILGDSGRGDTSSRLAGVGRNALTPKIDFFAPGGDFWSILVASGRLRGLPSNPFGPRGRPWGPSGRSWGASGALPGAPWAPPGALFGGLGGRLGAPRGPRALLEGRNVKK